MIPHTVSTLMGRSALRLLRAFAASLALAGSLAVPSLAAEPRLATPRPGVSDVMLARSALLALDSDAQLRDVNVVVSVVDRVAVIGGSVSSPAVSQRVEAVVRNITGIADVKNRCFVQPQADPLIRAVADRMNPNAGRKPSSQDLPGIVRPPRSVNVDEAYIPPTTAIVAAPPPVAKPPVVALKIPSNTPIRPSLLGDPIAAPNGPRYASLPPVPTISPVPAPTRLTTMNTSSTPIVATLPPRASDVLGRMIDLRKSESRFAGLTFEMKDGTIYLTGNTPRDADAWDFADLARRVPGVRQVVVGRVNMR